MKTTIKAQYCTPLIECIIIDSEVTLALESTPPMGPNETLVLNNPVNFTQNPFLDNKV